MCRKESYAELTREEVRGKIHEYAYAEGRAVASCTLGVELTIRRTVSRQATSRERGRLVALFGITQTK